MKTVKFVKTKIKNMDLQAEINWIQSEIAQVRDPYLIETLKNLLKYRKSKSVDRMSQIEFRTSIKEAEVQIESGDYLSIEDFEKESKEWG